MVQQFTKDGNFLSRFLKASPIGLMASTTWTCSLTRSINMLKSARGLPSVCLDFSLCLQDSEGKMRLSQVDLHKESETTQNMLL